MKLVERDFDSGELMPALILGSGVVKTTPSSPENTYPEGTCFFLDCKHVLTARHCGEILRESLCREGVRRQGDKEGYGQAVYDPRADLTFEVINETPFTHSDISILEIRPLVEPHEDDTPLREFYESWADRSLPSYLTFRRSPVEDGEELTFKGFTDIVFDDFGPGQEGKLREKVTATGILGTGMARWHERDGLDGSIRVLHIEGVSARGQNSGGPVFDNQGRIVGVVSQSPEGDPEPYTIVAILPFRSGREGREWTKLELPSADIQDKICIWLG